MMKAQVQHSRIAAEVATLKACPVSAALRGDGRRDLAMYLIKGSLWPQDEAELHCSPELRDEVFNQYEFKVPYEHDEVDVPLATLVQAARTGQFAAGWVTDDELVTAGPIPLKKLQFPRARRSRSCGRWMLRRSEAVSANLSQ